MPYNCAKIYRLLLIKHASKSKLLSKYLHYSISLMFFKVLANWFFKTSSYYELFKLSKLQIPMLCIFDPANFILQNLKHYNYIAVDRRRCKPQIFPLIGQIYLPGHVGSMYGIQLNTKMSSKNDSSDLSSLLSIYEYL